MKTAFLSRALWLTGTAYALTLGFVTSAHAFDITRGEVLRYRVFWGFFEVGTAELDYTPQGAAFGKAGGYALQARVTSDTPLMDMDDLWRSVGTHAAKPFTPQRYEVVQRENTYTANKLMAFEGKKVTYTNHKDATDTAPALAWDRKTRDPLSTVYAWRQAGKPVLESVGETSVIGLKRPFTLQRNKAEHTTLQLRGQTVPVWKVDLTSITTKKGKERHSDWTIWLEDTDDLTPLQIVGVTKFGTFRAQLKR